MIFLLFRIMDMKTAQKQLTRETGKCVPYRSQYISDSSMGTGTQHRETFIADQRHFRKRVAGMDYVEKTDKIDKLCSKRGAALYKFNSKVYRKDPKFKL